MRRLVPALVAALFVLAGCFSGGDTAAAPDRLRVALSFPPTSGLTPYGNEAVLATRLGVTEALTTLVDGEPRPGLATAWTQTSPTTWRFTVRPGVAFHDGTPLTPAAVANALNRAAVATPVPRAISSLKKAGTALAVVPDGDGVVVTTPVADPVLPNRLASPELAILGEGAYTDPARPSPVRAGTGPFVLTAVQGSTGATLDRNPTYWGGPVRAAGIDARFLADGAARANGIRAGEFDVADAIPVSQAASISAPAQVVGVPLPRSVAVYLDQRSPVLADPGLRAAVRDALRPLDVAGTVYDGRADPAAALFGPATPWAAARPPRTDTPATPANGARIRLATYSNRAELPEIATADADALRRAGFTVDVTVVDSAAFEAQLGTGAYDAVIVSRSQQLDTGDPVSYLASDFGCAGGYNWARSCDPATDAVLAQGGATTDVAARRQAALQAEARVLSADAVVPQVTERARVGVGGGVTGVAEDPTEVALITPATARS
ncbi:ABC transporter substrate-binding protein [Actinomycetospora soli]|uniref:ABC transporter substrate-binding protein n=1 Tax=Actinomycetospora soli TaxID=2893887 RepID=UPI001E4EDA90|nr:ABC transporter substrate-binding protein [Actinomycetospora soli]MCD2189557.1 ABC transporter substrate-binding protein [Actinomycetospora soli]